MLIRTLIVGMLVLANFKTAISQEFRSWTSEDSSHSVEAKLASVQDGQITLLKRDGSTVVVDANTLSRDDLLFLVNQNSLIVIKQQPANPTPANADPKKAIETIVNNAITKMKKSQNESTTLLKNEAWDEAYKDLKQELLAFTVNVETKIIDVEASQIVVGSWDINRKYFADKFAPNNIQWAFKSNLTKGELKSLSKDDIVKLSGRFKVLAFNSYQSYPCFVEVPIPSRNGGSHTFRIGFELVNVEVMPVVVAAVPRKRPIDIADLINDYAKQIRLAKKKKTTLLQTEAYDKAVSELESELSKIKVKFEAMVLDVGTSEIRFDTGSLQRLYFRGSKIKQKFFTIDANMPIEELRKLAPGTRVLVEGHMKLELRGHLGKYTAATIVPAKEQNRENYLTVDFIPKQIRAK